MKALLIDDEPDARENLRIMLADFTDGVEVVGEAGSVADAVDEIKRLEPEVLFLDIELGDGTGFDLLNRLPRNRYKVVFCTSHDQHILRALRLSAVDYLLKPIHPDDLQAAVERAGQALDESSEEVKQEVLRTNLDRNGTKRLVISDQNNIYLIDMADIFYCKGEGSYTRFSLRDQEEVMVSRSLKTYEQMLSGGRFLRVHHSYIVNLDFVRRIEKSPADLLVLHNGDKVPVASRRKTAVLQALTT